MWLTSLSTTSEPFSKALSDASRGQLSVTSRNGTESRNGLTILGPKERTKQKVVPARWWWQWALWVAERRGLREIAWVSGWEWKNEHESKKDKRWMGTFSLSNSWLLWIPNNGAFIVGLVDSAPNLKAGLLFAENLISLLSTGRKYWLFCTSLCTVLSIPSRPAQSPSGASTFLFLRNKS